MRDKSNNSSGSSSSLSPPNLFPTQQKQYQPSSSSLFSASRGRGLLEQSLISKRRGDDQMGEGYYNNSPATIDEMNGNESPKKRARTGSLSDQGGDFLSGVCADVAV